MVAKHLSESSRKIDDTFDAIERKDPILVVVERFLVNPASSNTLMKARSLACGDIMHDELSWSMGGVKVWREFANKEGKLKFERDSEGWKFSFSWKQLLALARTGEDLKMGRLRIPKAELPKLLALKNVDYVGNIAGDLKERSETLTKEIRKSIEQTVTVRK